MKRILIAGIILMLAAASVFATGQLILNEYNAVGSEKYLNADTYDGSTNVDTYFQEMAEGNHPDKLKGSLPNGRIQGNGGDWIELVVTHDHLDIRGWQIRWAEVDANGANEASGTNIWYGNGNIEQGILQFSQSSVWSNLRAGTIITIAEEANIYVNTANQNITYNVSPSAAGAVINMKTDVNVNPAAGDWWMNVSTQTEYYSSSPLVTCSHNVLNHQPWDWGCGNDAWQAQINDANGNLIFGPIGENITGWGGGGISSRECGRLEATPSATVTNSDFDDAGSSSFGQPNRWGTPQNVQDFNGLRAWYNPPANCQAAISMGYGNYFDINQDCYVDMKDFVVFAQNWMSCIDPNNSACSKPWLQQ